MFPIVSLDELTYDGLVTLQEMIVEELNRLDNEEVAEEDE